MIWDYLKNNFWRFQLIGFILFIILILYVLGNCLWKNNTIKTWLKSCFLNIVSVIILFICEYLLWQKVVISLLLCAIIYLLRYHKEWIKNNVFNIIFALIFGVGGYLLWDNTKPKEPQAVLDLITTIKENAKPVTTHRQSKENTKVEQEFKDTSSFNSPKPNGLPSVDSVKTIVESSKEEDVPECYTIRMDDFENALKAVSLVSRQEAAEDYHKSLSILVAMLALFGIGFPVIVAFLQHSFNESDLENIKIAKKQADNSLEENKKLRNDIFDLSQNLNTEMMQIYSTLSIVISRLKNGYNFSIIILGLSFFHQIKELETQIKITKSSEDYLNTRKVKEEISENQDNIMNLITKINNIIKGKFQLIDNKNAGELLCLLCDNYQEVLDNIRKDLPHDLLKEIDIEKLEKSVQEAKTAADNASK